MAPREVHGCSRFWKRAGAEFLALGVWPLGPRPAGGGGWGDPYKRDPEAVVQDVRNELVTAEAARAEYGVVVDTKGWTVDFEATEALRAERGSVELETVIWD